MLADLERRAVQLATQGGEVVSDAVDVAAAAASGAMDVAGKAAGWVGDHTPW